jgi:hypothetical protein
MLIYLRLYTEKVKSQGILLNNFNIKIENIDIGVKRAESEEGRTGDQGSGN